MKFLDQVVIVTGGGQGIGRAIAGAFAGEGAIVIIADIDTEAGEENRCQIQHAGHRAYFVPTDVSDIKSVQLMVEQVVTRFGKINGLINNAGISVKSDFLNESTETWDRVINTNLRGAYLCAKFSAPAMITTGGGAIINIASTRAIMSEPNSEAYAASKGGILALTHALAVTLGPKGIRVNAVSPGWIEVGDWQKISQAKVPCHTGPDQTQHPAGRVGRPADIATACLYLASPEAGFITGTNLVIDGGMTVKMIYAE